MQWYGGNIAEAVQKAKTDGAVFGVAIFGDDDNSKVLEASLQGDEVQGILNAGKFVCIRITASSEGHQQFAAIYTNAPSPSIYLIGDRGSPLEVISTVQTSSELEAKFRSAWSRHCAALNASNASAAKGSTSLSSSSPGGSGSGGSGDNVQGENPSATGQALVNANEAVRLAEVDVNQENITLEEKMERAKRLVEAKRQQKLAEEAEEAKRKERERRDMGKGLAELKRWQNEQEGKQLVEERKREKKEDQELRQRVKEQIAADRAARNARSNVSFIQEGPHPPPTEEQTAAASAILRPVGLVAGVTGAVPVDYSGQARLQFRLPSGSSISHAFEPVVTLGDVHTFLVDGNHVPFRQFSLSVAYPRRQFTNTDYSSTLRDLGLLPSAALLVLPLSGSSSSPSRDGSGIGRWITIIVSYLMIPFTFIYSLLQRALPSSATPTTTRPTNQRPRSSTSGASDASSSSTPGTSQPASAAAELRNRKAKTKSSDTKNTTEGNVHRLRDNEEDSEEDKATYNGNSTQQM